MEKFLPDFMKRFDRRLLLRSPLLWSVKLHYLAFYTFTTAMVLAALATSMPLDLEDSGSEAFLNITAILAGLILLGAWIFELRKFSYEKEHGIASGFSHLKRIFFVGTGVFMVAVLPFFTEFLYNKRMTSLADYETLTNDFNALNVGNVFYPTISPDFVPLEHITSGKMPAYGDDSRYSHVYNFRFFNNYHLNDKDDYLTEAQIYERIEKAFRNDQGREAAKKYAQIFRKYGFEHVIQYNDAVTAFTNGTEQTVVSRDDKYRMERILTRLVSAHEYAEKGIYETFLLLLVIVFPLAIVTELFAVLSFRNFFISAAGLAVFMVINIVFLIFLTEEMRVFSHDASQKFIVFYILAVALLVYFTAMRLSRQNTFSRLELMTNSWSAVTFPYLGVVLFFAVNQILPAPYASLLYKHLEILTAAYLGGVALNFAYFYPKLRSRLQSMMAKPVE